MKRALLGLALVAPMSAAWAIGCGDDEVIRDVDGGPSSPNVDDAGAPDVRDAATEAGPSCGAPSNAPPRILLSMNNATTSELVAIDLATKSVSGRLMYPGYIGTTDARGADPYLMEQAADVVAKLDRDEPWKVVSSWNVHGDDDGGLPNANPAAVVVPTCDKGYVLRFNRNHVLVIDTKAATDGGAPLSSIDLSAHVQADDHDGLVEMTNAVFVPEKKRVYALLGNIDLKKVAADGYTALCASTKPTIVAIDTETSAIVSLGGTGHGGSIELQGYNPPLGTPLWYDASHDRLLVLSAGCNLDVGDGGAGAISRRRVEAVDLATGQVSTLLSLDDQPFPTGMVLVDEAHAAIGFFGPAFQWNPAESALGPEIPGGFDFFASDGKGALVGGRKNYLGDGGSFIEVARVPLGDGGVRETLATDPFTDNSGYLSGAEVWPPPKP